MFPFSNWLFFQVLATRNWRLHNSLPRTRTCWPPPVLPRRSLRPLPITVALLEWARCCNPSVSEQRRESEQTERETSAKTDEWRLRARSKSTFFPLPAHALPIPLPPPNTTRTTFESKTRPTKRSEKQVNLRSKLTYAFVRHFNNPVLFYRRFVFVKHFCTFSKSTDWQHKTLHNACFHVLYQYSFNIHCIVKFFAWVIA